MARKLKHTQQIHSGIVIQQMVRPEAIPMLFDELPEQGPLMPGQMVTRMQLDQDTGTVLCTVTRRG